MKKLLPYLSWMICLYPCAYGQTLSNFDEYIILEKGHEQRWTMTPHTFGWGDFAFSWGSYVTFNDPDDIIGVADQHGAQRVIFHVDEIPAPSTFELEVIQGTCLFCTDQRVVGTITVLVIDTQVDPIRGCENFVAFNREALDSYRWAKTIFPLDVLQDEFLVRWENLTTGEFYFNDEFIDEQEGDYNINVFTYPSNQSPNGRKITGTLTIDPQPFIGLKQTATDLCMSESSVDLKTFISRNEGTETITVFAHVDNPGGGLVEAISTGPTLEVSDIPDNLVRDFVVAQYVTELNGCQSSTTTLTINLKYPSEISLNIAENVCLDGGKVPLEANLEGGMWSGPGVSGGIFDPAVAGIGTHTLQYEYTNEDECITRKEQDIEVKAVVTIDAGQEKTVCVGGEALPLVGSPANGTWAGVGMIPGSNVFDPAGLAPGAYQLTYEVKGSTGCTGTDQTTVTIVDNPTNVEAGPNLAMCFNDPTVVLTGQSPSNGVFEGNGIASDKISFDPELSGEGSFSITYKIKSSHGCEATDTRTVTVNPVPFVEAGAQIILCEDGASYPLTQDVSPAGGILEGNGVNGGLFQPASAGPGVHQIKYTFTDVKGCTNEDTRTIIVDPAITVEAGPSLSICEEDGIVKLDEDSSPPRGTWSGPGTIPDAETFDPALSGPGTFVLTYSIENPNGCNETDSRTITVTDTPEVKAGKDKVVCAGAGSINLFVDATPQGGKFEGTGVTTGGSFDPDAVDPGTYSIRYTYSDPGSSCSGVDYVNVTVFEPVPEPEIAAEKTKLCLGESIELSATNSMNGVEYSWFKNGGSKAFAFGKTVSYAPEESETVEVMAFNAFCQSQRESVDIEVAELKGDFHADGTEINSGDLVRFNTDIEGTSYYWDFGDNFGTSLDKNPSYYYYGAGSYSVTLTVEIDGACEKQFRKPSYINVKGEAIEIITSIDDEQLLEEIKFFPVPVGDVLRIELPKAGKYHITLLDAIGKELYQESFQVSYNLTHELPIGQNIPATFFVKIQNHSSKAFKLIR